MKTNHLMMLYDAREISDLFSKSHNLISFLNEILELLSHHMHIEIGMIGLYDETTDEITIKASKGLNKNTFGPSTLKLSDGLIGKSLQELRPIQVKKVSESPDYKMFPNLFIQKYETLLAIPISQGMNRIGILIVQRKEERPFSRNDISSLVVMTSQVGNLIAHVKMLLALTDKQTYEVISNISEDLRFIKGKSASGGYALSKSIIIRKEKSLAYFLKKEFLNNYSMEDFKNALIKTESQLLDLQNKIERKMPDIASLIFSAHILMIKDKEFVDRIADLITTGMNPPEAILAVGKKFLDMFAMSKNQLIREKEEDFEDLLTRLLYNLIYKKRPSDLFHEHIVIAKDLYPSDILKMSVRGVNGIILISGGITSHIAILSRSLQIPLIIADIPELLNLPDNTLVLLDAELGNIYLNPTKEIIYEFENQKTTHENIIHNKKLLKKTTITTDGTRINLLCNINLLSDLKLAREGHCDGIGLYRTEFPFLIRPDFPTEEEQYIVYCKLVEGMPANPITFRTLDIGGDKLLSYYDFNEKNPFLGFRSTRFTLQHKEIFVAQIRAMLRAGVGADLRIMFPMISSLEEFFEAKQVLLDSMKSLKEENIAHHSSPKIGIMVEIPSIIDIIDAMAQEVDFFSIGTNDLIQFLLAVDRTNEKIASLYNPRHPSVLRTLKKIVDSANRNHIDVSICGDMAHDEKYIAFLLGIGLRSLSINPIYIPKIKKMILGLDLRQAENLAKRLLQQTKITEINALLD
ncbi:phosphoenolpyruvate--protein phosphotransferase [Candidatus Omnitrophota bacterium]